MDMVHSSELPPHDDDNPRSATPIKSSYTYKKPYGIETRHKPTMHFGPIQHSPHGRYYRSIWKDEWSEWHTQGWYRTPKDRDKALENYRSKVRPYIKQLDWIDEYRPIDR